MAREVVDAIGEESQGLCFGRLVDRFVGSGKSSYTGIFVVGANHKNPSYVFTSSSPAEDGPRQIDKHVSLLVAPVGSSGSQPPKMVAKQWVSGLCFFPGCPRTKVVFSWPKCFTCKVSRLVVVNVASLSIKTRHMKLTSP